MMLQEEQAWSFSDELVCSCCISEPFLRDFIKDSGDNSPCSFCDGRLAPGVPLDSMMEIIGHTVQQYYNRAVNEAPYESAEGGYQAIALYFMSSNSWRIHHTLRVTPASEAGVANHVRSVEGNRRSARLRAASRATVMCVLRVTGKQFDPDSFLADSGLTAYEVFHAGEPRFTSRPDERFEVSGFRIDVSSASTTLPGQVSDAILFSRTTRRLSRSCGRLPAWRTCGSTSRWISESTARQ